MLKKLKDILNTYTDEQLEHMELYVNSSSTVNNILIDTINIDLISDDMKINIDVDFNL